MSGGGRRPHRESARWVVRDPSGHVRQMSLKPGRGNGHVWCTDITRGNADGLDMSGSGTRNVRRLPLEPEARPNKSG
jgi:hypothetical protein